MPVQRSTSLSMISRYSRTDAAPSQGVSGEAALDRRDARADGRERIVDLVHDAGRQLADGRELLALHDLGCMRCQSVTSSPIVITWVISSPSSRIGILLSR